MSIQWKKENYTFMSLTINDENRKLLQFLSKGFYSSSPTSALGKEEEEKKIKTYNLST